LARTAEPAEQAGPHRARHPQYGGGQANAGTVRGGRASSGEGGEPRRQDLSERVAEENLVPQPARRALAGAGSIRRGRARAPRVPDASTKLARGGSDRGRSDPQRSGAALEVGAPSRGGDSIPPPRQGRASAAAWFEEPRRGGVLCGSRRGSLGVVTG